LFHLTLEVGLSKKRTQPLTYALRGTRTWFLLSLQAELVHWVEEVRKAARNCSVLVGLFRSSWGMTGERVGRAFMAEEYEIVVSESA
jgi:hypothetical protein